MVMRKGAAKGTGKGYRNLRMFPKDPRVHSDSGKGKKQPQRIPYITVYDRPRMVERYYAIIDGQLIIAFEDGRYIIIGKARPDTKYEGIKVNIKTLPLPVKKTLSQLAKGKDTDGDGIIDILDCAPLDPLMQDKIPQKNYQRKIFRHTR